MTRYHFVYYYGEIYRLPHKNYIRFMRDCLTRKEAIPPRAYGTVVSMISLDVTTYDPAMLQMELDRLEGK